MPTEACDQSFSNYYSVPTSVLVISKQLSDVQEGAGMGFVVKRIAKATH